jgi:hypothetical protein
LRRLLVVFAAGLVLPGATTPEPERFEAHTTMRGCPVGLATLENQESLRLTVGCPLGADELGVAIGSILTTGGRELLPLLPRSLDLGRIVEHPWLAERLGGSAWASPDWDVREGRPREAEINRFTADLLRDRKLLDEVQDAFARHGMRASVTGVEKVLVGTVGEVPELRGLAGRGVDSTARLPFDAILWLRVEAADAPPP